MLIIGLTGGIGSGKTTVSNLFADYGTPIIDTDIIAKDLVNNDPTILQKLIHAFGDDITDENGRLNRKKLSSVVFTQPSKKQLLEDILHPRIREEVTKKIHAYASLDTKPAYIIVVIPLLLETGYIDLIDRILAVISAENIRIKRVQQRDDRKKDEILAIINSQVSDEERIKAASDNIDNNSNINELERKVALLHKKYLTLSVQHL